MSSEHRRIAYAVLANWDAGADPEVRDEVLDVMRSFGEWIRLRLAEGTIPAGS